MLLMVYAGAAGNCSYGLQLLLMVHAGVDVVYCCWSCVLLVLIPVQVLHGDAADDACAKKRGKTIYGFVGFDQLRLAAWHCTSSTVTLTQRNMHNVQQTLIGRHLTRALTRPSARR